MVKSIYDFKLTEMNGQIIDFNRFRDRVIFDCEYCQ